MPGITNYRIGYTEEEKEILKTFFSSQGNVFIIYPLLNIQIITALIARYSRSTELSIQKLFLKEFYPNMDLQEVELKRKLNKISYNNYDKKTMEIINRILGEYGDDSVAEVPNVAIGLEGMDQLTIKYIEGHRLFSGIEKSTRYIDYSLPLKLDNEGNIIGYDKERVSKFYLYKVPKAIADSNKKEWYEQVMDELFEFYKKTELEVKKKLKEDEPLENQKFPDDNGNMLEYNKLSEEHKISAKRAYEKAIEAKSYDICRSILPLATLTNMGLSENFRVLRETIAEMFASPNNEVKEIGEKMYNELENYAPNLINWLKNKHGQNYISNLKKRNGKEIIKTLLEQSIKEYVENGHKIEYNDKELNILRKENEEQNINEIVTNFLYPTTNLEYSELKKIVESNEELKRKVFDEIIKLRGDNRRNKIGAEGSGINYKIEFIIPISIWRDLQRHRNLTQIRQEFTIFNGYEIPKVIDDLGYGGEFIDKMNRVNELFIDLYANEKLKPYAQDVVTFAHKIKTVFMADLPELTWIIELRTSKGGDDRYRRLMYNLYEDLKKEQLNLSSVMRHVSPYDINETNLTRLYNLYKKKSNQ
ncbi:MAG: FAD-dependent thymidylate synthase [Candidatus Micrarchaeia archaeon]